MPLVLHMKCEIFAQSQKKYRGKLTKKNEATE